MGEEALVLDREHGLNEVRRHAFERNVDARLLVQREDRLIVAIEEHGRLRPARQPRQPHRAIDEPPRETRVQQAQSGADVQRDRYGDDHPQPDSQHQSGGINRGASKVGSALHTSAALGGVVKDGRRFTPHQKVVRYIKGRASPF